MISNFVPDRNPVFHDKTGSGMQSIHLTYNEIARTSALLGVIIIHVEVQQHLLYTAFYEGTSQWTGGVLSGQERFH